MNTLRKILSFGLLTLTISAYSQVTLPRLISDGMILQRDANVKIWGWASPNEKISLIFNQKTYSTIAGEDKKWAIALPNLKAGGPYTMVINASNRITINNIMVGDVWICSGQSNMEFPMGGLTYVYESEIANSTNPNIRQFLVPQTYNFKKPQEDLNQGKWMEANPQIVLQFSAAAYFFAKSLYQKYKIPIGLINASLGGSPAEAWISEEALKEFPAYYNELQRFKDDSLIAQIQREDKARSKEWYTALANQDLGYKNPSEPWTSPYLNCSDWETMNIPGYWKATSIGAANGAVWFKKDFDVPAAMAGKSAKILLGRIVDGDSVFINGVFAGTTSFQYPQRRYDIKANMLKEGKNNITIKIISNSGNGGLVEDKPYEIVTEAGKIDLKGEWHLRLGATMEPLKGETFIRWKPAGLYNAMIAPLESYAIKGAIWYQGESNTWKFDEYCKLQGTLIADWRKRWNQGNFPFVFVQLPNFMAPQKDPSEGGWAFFREAQLKTLTVPNTAMAIAIDLGEWNDIHPVNKLDVGTRLAIAAQKIAYSEKKEVSTGPIYKSMKIEGNKIILSFSNIGKGLVAKNGDLKSFAIAGSDKIYHWAKAVIEKNTVVVWSENIFSPVSVRYAWANNPASANLYNKEGLPASPFRTDE